MTSTGRYIPLVHRMGRVYTPPIRRLHPPTFGDRVGAALLMVAVCLSALLGIVLVGILLAIGFQLAMILLELWRWMKT